GMGQLSLIAPLGTRRFLDQVTPGKGRRAKAALGVTAGAAVAVTAADILNRRVREGLPEAGTAPQHGRTSTDSEPGAGDRAGTEPDSGFEADPAPKRGNRQLRRAARFARRIRSSATATALVGAGVTAAA